MQSYKKILPFIVLPLFILTLSSCDLGGLFGGGDEDNSSSSTDYNYSGDEDSSDGKITSKDGSPLSGVTVALSSDNGAGYLKKAVMTDEFGRIGHLTRMLDADGDECADVSNIQGEVYAYDCTDSTGKYELTGEIPCNTKIKFSAIKGSFSMSFSLEFSCPEGVEGTGLISVSFMDTFIFDDDCGLDEDSNHSDCQFDAAKMAVVTGAYDDMQNVLAKLGYGSVTSSGYLDKSKAFDFTLIDGDDSLSDSEYDNFDDFVSDLDNLSSYDIIFINCGNAYEHISEDPQVKANLQAYVENGGKLYVTDWSYMFVEQSFPSFMDFLLGGNDPDVAEFPYDAAKAGEGGITTDATIADSTMAEWLDGVYVNTGNVDYDCYYVDESDINAELGARNSDGTVTIGDFLSSWVVMVGDHSGIDDPTYTWISGPISHYFGSDASAPLTVTQNVGAGRILYSSYHTAHSCPTQGFWPQERILQYLVFEL